MSHILLKKLDNFKTYKVDSRKQSILNLNSVKKVNLDDFFEISNILDSTYMNYKVDSDLNIIVLGKR